MFKLILSLVLSAVTAAYSMRAAEASVMAAFAGLVVFVFMVCALNLLFMGVELAKEEIVWRLSMRH